MKPHFMMFAAYNRWANERLYDVAQAMSDADYRMDKGAFFGSLHQTLNHILVADRIWMHRFTGEGPAPTQLDAILYDKLGDLKNARVAEDKRIIGYIDGLSENDIASNFTYRTISNPQDITQPLAPALAHFFNHQTHHRGQAHATVTALAGRDAMPSLDLLQFQRQTGVGLS